MKKLNVTILLLSFILNTPLFLHGMEKGRISIKLSSKMEVLKGRYWLASGFCSMGAGFSLVNGRLFNNQSEVDKEDDKDSTANNRIAALLIAVGFVAIGKGTYHMVAGTLKRINNNDDNDNNDHLHQVCLRK